MNHTDLDWSKAHQENAELLAENRQLEATNKELLDALENVTYYIETDDMKFLDMNKAKEAITNAKQVMGDDG